METSAKTRAYLRAAEVVKKAKAWPGLYDRKTAAAVNSELQKIAASLVKSAQRNHNNEHTKQLLDADPALKASYEMACKIDRYHRACKTANRIADEVRPQRGDKQ